MSVKRPPIGRVLALAAAVLAGGCGIKGSPELAGDRDDMFPRVYPEGAVRPEAPPPNIFVERYRER